MLGFSKGKINLVIEQNNPTFGEEITGEVSLKLKKPINAKRLYIKLFAKRISRGYKNQRTVKTIFELEQQLDTEHEYTNQPLNYKFKIKLPKKPEDSKEYGNVIGFLKTLNNVHSYDKWYLEARLDCSGLDLKKKIQINIV